MFASLLLAVALGAPVAPMHGTILSTHGAQTIVRMDAITSTAPAKTRVVTLVPYHAFPPGTGIDGYASPAMDPQRLLDVVAAGPFTPGLPDRAKTKPLDVSSTIPSMRMVDQDGRFTQLDAWRGKIVVLSFIFTRCPIGDVCPLISAKFSQLQKVIDPKTTHLLEISLDPVYDSPSVLRAYLQQFGGDPARWTMLTTTGSQTQHLLNRFGISSLRISTSYFTHDDRLFIIGKDAKILEIIETSGWNPSDVAAEISNINGLATNPLERLRLSLIASVVALCGGSQYTGVVLLELALFFIILGAVVWGLIFVGRILKSNR